MYPRSRQPRSRTQMRIAIASGKGGTGKTFVSTNLYALMDKLGMEVSLVDCDAEVPNSSIFVKMPLLDQWDVEMFTPTIDKDKCIYCGDCANICRFNSITCVAPAKYIKVQSDGCHGCKACLYACKHGAITPQNKKIGAVSAHGEGGKTKMFEARANINQKSPVPIIKEAIDLSIHGEGEYLILDAPPGCSCPFVHTVLPADFVLLVTEPTPFGLSDLKHSISVLRTLNRRFGVIINRSDIGCGEIKKYLQEEGIDLLAEIPYSEKIVKEYASGNLLVHKNKEIEDIFQSILNKLKQHEDSNS